MSGGGTGLMSGGGLSMGSGGLGKSGRLGCSIMPSTAATTLPDFKTSERAEGASASLAEARWRLARAKAGRL
jgi:hypothetical protein